jgi:hypothetical protein
MINFYKNLVMAGGFLYVINFGAGVLSFDDGVPAVRQGAIFACLVVSRYQMITFLHPKLSHAAKGDIPALELS